MSKLKCGCYSYKFPNQENEDTLYFRVKQNGAIFVNFSYKKDTLLIELANIVVMNKENYKKTVEELYLDSIIAEPVSTAVFEEKLLKAIGHTYREAGLFNRDKHIKDLEKMIEELAH